MSPAARRAVSAPDNATTATEMTVVYAERPADAAPPRAAPPPGEDRYRLLFDAIDEGFCVVEMVFDRDGNAVDYRFLEANPAFERHTGLVDAVGRTAREMVPDLEEHWFAAYGRVATSGEPARFVADARPLEGRAFDVYAFRLSEVGGRQVGILFTDVTERLRAEERLRASEARFRTLIQRSADAIQLVSPDGTILYSSDSVEAVLGYRPDEIAGHGVAPYVHPDDLPAVVAWIGEIAATPGGTGAKRYRVRHKDGSWAWVETTIANHLDTPGIGAIVGNFRNVTVRLALERQKDEFIAAAAHELKTPVTGLKGFAQFLRNRFRKAGDEAAAALMETMDAQVDRLAALVNALLDATSVEAGRLPLRLAPLDPDALVDEAIAELRLTTERHPIRREGRAGATIVGDRDRIGQVLANYLSNAIEYSPAGGEVVVGTAADADGISVCVRDRGIGIPAAEVPRVFDRFYRVDGPGAGARTGLGLGLYLSAQIVERHGGRVWAESVEGEGSSFCFRLPLTPPDPNGAGAADLAAPMASLRRD